MMQGILPPLRRHAHDLQLLLLPALLMVVLWGLIVFDLQRSKDNLQARNNGDLSNLTLAFSEQIESSIKVIDLTLLDLREHWKTNSPDRFAAMVRGRQSYLANEFAFQVAVIGPDGMLAFSNLERITKPLDLSDREHFQFHRSRITDELFISKPLLGRVSGRWSIQFTRPIYDETDSFRGVLVLSVSPEYFYRFYDSIHLLPHSVIMLMRHDGEVLSRFPKPEQALGRKISGAPFLQPLSPDSDFYSRVSQIDGIERAYAWRKVERYGVIVAMGHAVKEFMAPYDEQRSRALLAGAASSALLLLVTYLKFISARQQRQTAQRLADNEERWRLALEAAGDGVWDWDIAAQRILYSTGWIAMIGHQPEEISDQIEEWKKRIHPEDLSQALQALDQHLTGHSNAYVNEHRILCKGGHWKWMLDRGMVIARDPNGAPLRMVGTHTDISARKRLEEELRILATTDALTGLCNRRCFLEELHAEFERFKRYPASQAGVLMLDIDFFKKINDQHGHAIGDAALRHFGAQLRSVLRRTDIAGRLGGEEFAVILMEINLENAVQFATRLCAHVRHHPLMFEDRTIPMSVSIGLSMLQRDDEHSETVLHRADRALYQAKLGGRDRLVVDDPAAPQAQAPGELQRQEDSATAPPGVRPRPEATTAADPGSPAARPGPSTSG